MSTKFHYTDLGQTLFIDEDDRPRPIPNNHVYGVSIGKDEYRRVLGLVQANPSFPNQWCAVAATDPAHYPAVDLTRGLWDMSPGRSGFGSKREAAVWLLGVSDTRQAWFTETPAETPAETLTTVEITWRGAAPVMAGALATDIAWAHDHGYTVYEWADVDADKRPVTLTRLTTSGGHTVALFETRKES